MSLSDNKVIHGDPEYGDPEYGDKRRKDSFTAKVQRQLSVTSLDDGSTKDGQLFSMVDVDPALDAKMHIVNNVWQALGCSFMSSSVTDFVSGNRPDWLDRPPHE